jgi:hypothetical protein
MPSASTSRLRLPPFLARSVGFLPVFFPPEGCLGQAPVQRQPGPVDALQAVVFEESSLPELKEDAGLDPLLEAIMGGGAGAELGGVQRLPLAAGAEHEEDGIHTFTVIGAGPASAEAVPVGVHREQDLHLFPKRIGDTPLVRRCGRCHGQPSVRIHKPLQEL